MKPRNHSVLIIFALIFLLINSCKSGGGSSNKAADTPAASPHPVINPVVNPDCNGDDGGTAYIDNCGFCVGGNTGLTDCLVGCDCGSTDQANPCTGQSISTTVTATTVNGANSVDSVFSWTFNSGGGNAQCGQFANGDYWIAPAVGETTVTITDVTGSGSITVDADPVMESTGILDGSNAYGNHDATENIIPDLPVSYTGINSLLAAIQRDEATEGNCGTGAIWGECVDAYQVITILDNVPADAGSTLLRPNITGQSKDMLSLNEFDFSRLPSKVYLTGTDAAGYEAMRQRWSHSTEIFSMLNSSALGYSEGGRAFRSHIIIDDYGSGTAVAFNNDLMTIFSDDNTLPEKQAALAAMLSYGLDLYHGYFNAPAQRYWAGVGGQYPGKYTPVAFMASLLTNPTYANNMKAAAATIDTVYNDLGPQELAQFHESAGRTPVYGHYKTTTQIPGTKVYWRDLFFAQCFDGATGTCNTGIGNKTQLDPHGYIDGPATKAGGGYMTINLGIARGMLAIANIMPEVCATINYPLLGDYVMGLHNNGLDTADDPCVTPDSREDLNTCNPAIDGSCVYFGTTWGPTDPSVAGSDCIKTATPSFTQVGRFVSLDGTPVTLVYTTTQAEANWATIMAPGTCW